MKPTVTVAALVYKSPRWLDWLLRNLARARNDATFKILVVGNDANTRVEEWIGAHAFSTVENQNRLTEEVRLLGSICELDVSADMGLSTPGGAFIQFRYVGHRNENPSEYAMARVYRAWNRCVAEAQTEDVVLVNTDMAFHDGWLDELLALRARNPRCLPTSLLVESGRMLSGLPDYVQNCGTTPDTFDRARFELHAKGLKARGVDDFSGGLFMPVLWRKADFERVGGYWIQTPDHVLASDAVTFNKARELLGLEHRTAARSIVYHAQEGETRDE